MLTWRWLAALAFALAIVAALVARSRPVGAPASGTPAKLVAASDVAASDRGEPGDADLAPLDSAAPRGVLVGAGDVASCASTGSARTARLLDAIPGTVFVAGDAAYEDARDPDPYRNCYGPTWGRHRARTRPVLGNHDVTPDALEHYFAYFGASAGPRPDGWYSYEVGPWHVVALNSNVPSGPGSPQDRWLVDDLARHAGRCAVAIMHHPRFSSGPHQNEHYKVAALWRRLATHGVSVAIAGHDHLYERFTPMDGDGRPDSTGIREFVVGTGGGGHYPVTRVDTGSVTRIVGTYGVLALTLDTDRYAWRFVPSDPGRASDGGSSRCRPLRRR